MGVVGGNRYRVRNGVGMRIVIRAALAATLLLAGCSALDKSHDEYDQFADKHSAYQLLPRERSEERRVGKECPV